MGLNLSCYPSSQLPEFLNFKTVNYLCIHNAVIFFIPVIRYEHIHKDNVH